MKKLRKHTIALFFNAYQYGDCGRPGMWEYAERIWYTWPVAMELNVNKNRRGKILRFVR